MGVNNKLIYQIETLFNNKISKDSITQAINNLDTLINNSKKCKLPSLNDYVEIKQSTQPIQQIQQKPKPKAKAKAIETVTQPIETVTQITTNNTNNRSIMSFINKINATYHPLEIYKKGDKKMGYHKLLPGWRDRSFIESVQQEEIFNRSNNPNTILYKVPKNIVIFDIDSKEAHTQINKFCETSNYKPIITRSFSFSGDEFYKLHYYFRIDFDEKINCQQFGNYDIIHQGGQVAELLRTYIEYDSMPTINKNDYNELYTKLNDISSKPNAITNNIINSAVENTKESHNVGVHNYKYVITDAEILDILSLLPVKYNNDRMGGWLQMTTILKQLDKKEIWENWSKKSINYDEAKNNATYNSINLKEVYDLDINTIIKILNTEHGHTLPYIKRYKPNEPLIKQTNIQYIMGEAEYIDELFTYDTFLNNDTILINSCTGTGKTTSLKTHLIKYLKDATNKHTKIITLTALMSLSDQHEMTFDDLGMVHYKKTELTIADTNIMTVCINSLNKKLKMMTKKDMQNTILFIDEVESFLQLSHNKTLNGILKNTFELLIKLIKNCKKIIVADAKIPKSIFELLKTRPDATKIFINNKFKKYAGLKAIKINDETIFLNNILNDCNNNNYFLAAYDTIKTAEDHYNMAISQVPTSEHYKYILITSKSQFKLINANEQFKNKFVFYSPSIVYGVDFSSLTIPQRVYLYVKGNSISPTGFFQQATRCRKIKELLYYGCPINKNAVYVDIEDVKEQTRNFKIVNDAINNLCKIINEDDEIVFCENSFFKLWTFNEFQNDMYTSNKIAHFEIILREQGFILSELGEIKTIDKKSKKDMRQIETDNIEMMWTNYLKLTDEERCDQHEKYSFISNNIDFYGLFGKDNETLIKYKDYILNEPRKTAYLNTIKLLKADNYINKQLNNLNEKTYDIKIIDSDYNKINLLRKFESEFDIGHLDIEFDKGDQIIEMKNDMYLLFKKLFRTTTPKPTNNKDLKKLYVQLIRNITTSKIITSKQIKSGKNRDAYSYKLNSDYINECLELNKISSYYNENTFHENIISTYELKDKSKETSNNNIIYKSLNDIFDNC